MAELPEVSGAGAVAAPGGTVQIVGAVASGRDVHIGRLTVIADDGPPVGDQAARPGALGERCPYPGLLSFGPDDADLFFGRDADRDAVLAMLGRSGLVAVIGSSGSGKSSLLAAAVIPAAQSAAAHWRPVVLRPGADPLGTLTAAVAANPPAVRPTLWVIDQFEEAFDPAVDPAGRRAFLDALLALSAEPLRGCVLIALRSDFYAALDADARLARAVAAAQHRLVPLDPAAVEDAVTRPAERVGLRVEPALTATVAEEMTAQPGALPLLGYALQQTWRRRRNGWLTLTGYVEAGGIARALQDGAQRAWTQLSEPGRQTARRLLLRLSHVDDNGVAVRRRRLVAELVTDADGPDAVTTTVNALARARLLTVSEDSAGRPVVEIAHESLLLGWPLLRDWLREDRDAARVRDELIEAVGTWVEHDRDPEYLLSPGRLSAVRTLHSDRRMGLTSTERRFLADSQRRARRQRRTRRLLPALAALVLVASGVASVAFLAQRRADRERGVADALQVAAAARSVVSNQRDLGVLLALAAYRSHPDPTTLATLVDGVAVPGGPVGYARPTPHANVLAPGLTATGAAVVGLSDGRLALVPRGAPATYLTGHDDAVTAVCLVGGSTVVSGDASGAVLLHRLGHPAPAAQFPVGVRAQVGAVAVASRAGLVFAAAGRTVERFSLADPARRLAGWSAPQEITDLTVVGGDVVAATEQGSVLRWTLSGRALAPLAGANDSLAPGPRLAADGHGRLAAVDGEGVHLWADAAAPSPHVTSAVSAGARSVLWTPDGSRLYVRDQTGTVHEWQPGSPPAELGARYTGMAADPSQFSTAGLATGGGALVGLDAAGTLVRWQLGEVSPAVARVAELSGTVQAVAVSAAGTLATGDVDGTVTVLPPGQPVGSVSVPGPVGGLLWAPGGGLFVGAGDGAVYAADPARHSVRRIGSVGPAPVVALAADGPDRFAALSGSGELHIFGFDGSSAGVRRFPSGAHALAISASGMTAVSSGDGTGTRITVQRADGSHRTVLRGHTLQVDSLAFRPDGRQLASGSDDRTVRLWSVPAGRTATVLRGHTDMVTTLGYDASGTMLASGSQDGTIRLWSDRTGVEVGAPLTDAAGFVAELVVAGPDVVAANGRVVDRWPLTAAAWTRSACALAARDLRPAEWRQYAPALAPRRLCG